MIAISIWLFIVMFFFAGAIGYATCWLCTKAKVGDAVMKKAHWKRQFENERDSHNGTQKRYIELIQKLKEIDKQVAEKVRDAEQGGYLRGLDKAQELTNEVFKEAK